MPIALTSSKSARAHERAQEIAQMLLAEPAAAAKLWHRWRAGVDADDFDDTDLALLPLLSGRLGEWIASDPDGARLRGICKRGWARNQLALQQAATLWKLLNEAGANPLAFCGDVALALRFRQESSTRPIGTIEILVPREQAQAATGALEHSGWRLNPEMPQPEGRVLDQYTGVWFDSPLALLLRWRLADVSPEEAAASESAPAVVPITLPGVEAFALAPEELLLQALTRSSDGPVPWYADAAVLLRGPVLDWPRLQSLATPYPPVPERLAQLREEFGVAIPAVLLERRPRSLNRLAIWRQDYRQVAWQDGQTTSLPGFARYMLKRTLRQLSAGTDLTVIEPTGTAGASRLSEYLRFSSLFVFLTLRDIRVRYRQTWRGIFWALLQPILPMLLLAAIFSRIVRPELPRGPYWLFVLTGLAPWNFFANAVNYAGATFAGNANLLSKVYFPRAILPLAAVSACVTDLLVTSVALIALAWATGAPPTLRLLILPAAFVAATVIAATVGLAAASMNLLYRDLKPLIPFLVQVAMYAGPVLYPLEMIPAGWRWAAWLNPMTAVLGMYRFALLGTPLDGRGCAISLLALSVFLAATLALFGRVEADIAERL